jgi:hypothetical protein
MTLTSKDSERIQHFINAIIAASEDIDLAGMDRIEALCQITNALLRYEIEEEHPDDKEKILSEYEGFIARMSITAAVARFDKSWFKPIVPGFDPFKANPFSDEVRESNK